MTATVLRGVGGLGKDAALAFGVAHYGGALEAAELEPAGGTWADVSALPTTAKAFPASVSMLILELPMVPAGVTGGSLANGATGAYDAQLDAFVSAVVNAGIASRAVVSIGPEFNRTDRPWSANLNPAAFVTYWQRIATKLKAAGIRTAWTVTVGQTGVDPTTVWPGSKYVDFVGAVLYDYKKDDATITAAQRWTNTLGQTNGLTWLASFAKANLKPILLTRWGLDLKTDTLTGVNGGGGDDVLFVQNTFDWIKANYVAALCAYQVDVGAIPSGPAAYFLTMTPDGLPDPSVWRSSHGSGAPTTAIQLVGGRFVATSGTAGNNAVTDRAMLALIAGSARYEWDVRAKIAFGGANDFAELYPGAALFDPAAGSTAVAGTTTMGTGLQVQLAGSQWRLGYRASSGFVTLASGTWAKPIGTDVGIRVLTGPLVSGAQDFYLFAGTSTDFDTDPTSLAQVAKVTLTAAQRTAAGGPGSFMFQQLGAQGTQGAQTTGFSWLQAIPGAT